MPRIVAEERLDHLAPEDLAARRSRRDLVRVHRAAGDAWHTREFAAGIFSHCFSARQTGIA